MKSVRSQAEFGMLEFSQVSVRQTIYGLLIETTACSSSILLVTERMFAYKTEGIDAGDLTSCCPCCASLLWLEFSTFQGPRLIESAADRFLHFLLPASTLRPVRFSYSQRDYTLPYLSRESRPRHRRSNCLQFAGRIRNTTPSWNNMADRFSFDCLRANYFTVRSIRL